MFIIFPSLLWGSALQAQVLTTVTLNGSGRFLYSYEIENSTSFDIFQFSLNFSFDQSLIDWNPVDIARGGDVSVPLGDLNTFVDDWQAEVPSLLIAPGSFVQDFKTLSSFGFGDVSPGESLSGYSFTSSYVPEEISYTVFSPSGDSLSGTTLGPSGVLVPEPSSFLLLVSSFLLFARKRAR